MARRRKAAIVLGALILALACSAPPADSDAPAPATTESADHRPSVVTMAGESVEWAQMMAADRPTVIVVVTPWCQVCRREQPHVERFARDHAETVRTVYLITGTSTARAAEIAAERNMAPDGEMRVWVDPPGAVARYFSLKATPAVILIRPSMTDPQTQAERFSALAELPSLTDSAAAPPAFLVAAEEWEWVTDSGRELGTSYDVVVATTNRDQAQRDLRTARALCHRLDAVFSEWRADSEISRINRDAGKMAVPISPDMARLIAGSLHVSRATQGAFDVTYKPIGKMWDRAAQTQQPPDPDTLADTLAAVDYRHVILARGATDGETSIRFAHPGVELGIAGVAKGWIIDAIFLHLHQLGYPFITVNIGGDLRTAGIAPEAERNRFYLRDPYDPRLSAGSLRVMNSALATSGNYWRHRTVAGATIGHILDPRTGLAPDFDGSVTVLAPDAAMADALATAMFVMGPEAGLALATATTGIDAIFVTRTGIRSTLPPDHFTTGTTR